MKRYLLPLMLIFLIIPVEGKVGKIKLLAVTETSSGLEGSTADLYLEIIPGNGRVFLDTFPLTKLDTQMSTRFAKEIACYYTNKNCDNLDFIYTVRATAPIIGGPSAGSAVTVLTAAMLLGKDINESVSITGTINSGGIIGPVVGLQQKIEAAREYNLTKVLIPTGTRKFHDINYTFNGTVDRNETIDLVEFGEGIGVEVVETSFFDEALSHFTDYMAAEPQNGLVVSEEYNKTMRKVARELCERTKRLKEKTTAVNNPDYDNAINLTIRGADAFNSHNFYSAASYCFGANVKYSYYYFNQSNANALKEKIDLIEDIFEFSEKFNGKDLHTISDLQTSIVVNERIDEAKDVAMKINRTDSYYDLAYASERFNSAVSWSNFYGIGKKKLKIDSNALKESCIKKIKEAEERYQYSNLLFPNYFDDTKDEINKAFDEMNSGNYANCLFKASKAKAQSNVFIGLMGNSERDLNLLINTKHKAVERLIRKQIDGFPILGYSYFEYSKSLQDHDQYSSLLYAEYSLEISDLNMYFKSNPLFSFHVDYNKLIIFLSGLVVGIALSFLWRKR